MARGRYQAAEMGQRKSSAEDRLRATYPDEPWRWRKSWETGVVAGATQLEAVFWAVFGLIFLGLSLPATLAIPEEVKQGNYAILLVLLFTAVGLGILWVALRRFSQLRRFGKLTFKLQPFPGSWGGGVGGSLVIPKGAWVTGEVKAALQCKRIRVQGAGKNRRRSEAVLWETDRKLSAQELGGMGLKRTIPIRFLVERDQGQPSDVTVDRDYVDWTVAVEVPVRGRRQPLQAEFAIPVFDCGESLKADTELSSKGKGAREEQRQDALAEAGVNRTQQGSVEVWSFHQPSARKHSLGLILFGGIFGAVAWWVPVLIMQLAFGGFALLMFAIVPGIICHRSELHVGPREVLVRRRGVRGWKSWRIPGDEIAALALTESMRAGQTRYLRLTAIGVLGVDPEKPHPAEHFKAPKARYRWKREHRNGGTPREATMNALLETPCFKIELAGYLKGTRAAEDVKLLLERRLGIAER